MSERLRISPEELRDPRIDRELAAQAGFGTGSAPTSEPAATVTPAQAGGATQGSGRGDT